MLRSKQHLAFAARRLCRFDCCFHIIEPMDAVDVERQFALGGQRHQFADQPPFVGIGHFGHHLGAPGEDQVLDIHQFYKKLVHTVTVASVLAECGYDVEDGYLDQVLAMYGDHSVETLRGHLTAAHQETLVDHWVLEKALGAWSC